MSLCFPFQTIKLLNKELLTNTNTAYTWMMSVEVKLFFLCKKGNSKLLNVCNTLFSESLFLMILQL